jgi:hypothetical protein
MSFVTLMAATTFEASPSANPTVQGTEIQLPVIVYQMEVENGEMPVILQCGTATVTVPDTMNGFSCTLINNTDKNIVAATVAYTIEYEQRGKTYREVRSHLAATFVHPDFSKDAKPVPRGGGLSIRPGGSFTFEGAVIKGVEVRVDYVEFNDGSGVGPNKKDGAEAVKALREGASRYKNWLVRRYRQGSIDTALQSLQADPPSAELGLTNEYLEQGANLYRKRLQRVERTRGRAEVQKYLSK